MNADATSIHCNVRTNDVHMMYYVHILIKKCSVLFIKCDKTLSFDIKVRKSGAVVMVLRDVQD